MQVGWTVQSAVTFKTVVSAFRDPAGASGRLFSIASRDEQSVQGPNQRPVTHRSLLGSFGDHTNSGLLQSLKSTRQFTVAAHVAAAAPAESPADDVVAQVLSCAASNNTETGVLSQVGCLGSSLHCWDQLCCAQQHAAMAALLESVDAV